MFYIAFEFVCRTHSSHAFNRSYWREMPAFLFIFSFPVFIRSLFILYWWLNKYSAPADILGNSNCNRGKIKHNQRMPVSQWTLAFVSRNKALFSFFFSLYLALCFLFVFVLFAIISQYNHIFKIKCAQWRATDDYMRMLIQCMTWMWNSHFHLPWE